MDGYAEYGNLLRGAIQQQSIKQAQAENAFKEKLAETEREKNMISTATEGLGAAFATPAISSGIKAVSKNVAGKVVRAIENTLKPSEEPPELTPEDPAETARTQAANDLGGAGERDFIETGTELPEVQDAPEAETSFSGGQISTTDEGVADLMRQRGRFELRDDIVEQRERPVGEGDGSTETANASGEAEQAASSATADAAEGATTTAAEGGLEAGAEAASATATAAEAGIDASLLADPLTAVFGLIFGGIIAAAGIGGAESIKNPSIPKPPPIANVSTQFGIGGRNS